MKSTSRSPRFVLLQEVGQPTRVGKRGCAPRWQSPLQETARTILTIDARSGASTRSANSTRAHPPVRASREPCAVKMTRPSVVPFGSPPHQTDDTRKVSRGCHPEQARSVGGTASVTQPVSATPGAVSRSSGQHPSAQVRHVLEQATTQPTPSDVAGIFQRARHPRKKRPLQEHASEAGAAARAQALRLQSSSGALRRPVQPVVQEKPLQGTTNFLNTGLELRLASLRSQSPALSPIDSHDVDLGGIGMIIETRSRYR